MTAPQNKLQLRSQAIAIILATLLLSAVLVWFGASVVNRQNSMEGLWQNYQDHAVTSLQNINEINSHFGYGGFIHNFKNLVLRRDASLIAVAEQNLRDTYAAIDRLQTTGILEEQREAIATFRQVVDQYADKLRIAGELLRSGETVEYIDTRVKVDDKPALQALDTLTAHIQLHSRETATETGRHMAQTRQFILYGLWLIPLLFIIAIAMIQFLKRTVRANRQLAEAKQYADDLFEAVPDALVLVNEQGEIIRSNIEAVKLLGYSRDELQSMTVEDLLPQRLREVHVGMRNAAFQRHIDRPMEASVELVAQPKAGGEIPVEISLSFSDQDKGILAIVSLRDISERKQAEVAIRRNEEIFSKAQQIANLGSWEWNITDNTLSWSDEVYRIFGLQPQQFPASYEKLLKYIHQGDRKAVEEAVTAAVEHNAPYRIEHRVVRPGGEQRVVLEEGTVFRHEDGTPYQMIGTVLDITERSRAEAQLQLAKKVFDNSLEAILVLDIKGNIVDMNDAFGTLTGYSRDELLCTTPSMLSIDRHSMDFYTSVWPVLTTTDFWQGELWNRRRDGTLSPCMASVSKVKNSRGKVTHYVAIFLDISAIKESQAQLEKLAHFDQLTGLANRLVFHDRLHSGLARAHRRQFRLAVIYIDLDGFKQVNDQLGHEAGDDLLIKAAHLLKECVREDDTVARLGGDEFAILLHDQTERMFVELVAERVIEKLAIQIAGAQGDIPVSASMGIAMYPADGTGSETLLRHADQAMYHAKNNGKNRFCFFADI